MLLLLASTVGFSEFLRSTQQELCSAFEKLDGKGHFCTDEWSREDGSKGTTRVLQGGDVIEKGCVSTTFAVGTLSKQRAEAMSARGRAVREGQPYRAAALSIVLHARAPPVPTLRGDVRVFAVGDDVWFGGGADLTPAYLYDDDARDFHAFWKAVCDRHGGGLYERFKAWCDDYFFLPFRREHRGIGGIFFDDLDSAQIDDPEAFARDVAAGFVESWAPIVARRRHVGYDDAMKRWQLLRRGRYLEFNLMSDRGVKFGLSPDSIERVMVSAPPLIAWEYGVDPPPASSEEARLLAVLKEPRDWLSSTTKE